MGRGLAIALVALLFVSVGLNVFALGHVSGRMIAGHPPATVRFTDGGPRGGFQDPFRIVREAEALSPELGKRFRESFREQLPQMRETHEKVRTLRKELGALMSADVWDAAAIRAKLDEIRAVEVSQQKAFSDGFLDVFSSLPADERKALIEAANERRKERHMRWKERREGPGGDMPTPEGDGFGPPPPPEGEGFGPPPEED